jgi:outer membrane protein assembly factor BamD (BamD/ComL family)
VTKNLLLRTALVGCGVVLSGCASNQSIMNASSRPAATRAAMDGDPKATDDQASAPVKSEAPADGGFLARLNPANLFAAPKPPPPPVDDFVVRPEGLTPVKAPEEGTTDARLAGARDLFRRAEYAKAQVLYHAVANETKAQPVAVQEGLFFEAECLRLQGIYPRAADTYNDLLSKFSNTPYRDQAVQHMFDIANYWLEDTRKDMKDWEEYKENKRWFFWPRFANWDKSKPILDEEGRAVEKLEQVHLNDIGGPLADQALFYAGSVKMYNGDWRDADSYFSQIFEHHPNSPLAPKAVELAIMAKNLSTGGPEYDGRKAAEARRLVDAALRNYPELSNDPKKREYLERQLAGINLQQAAKDYEMAEFWKRTGHPGAAYFQFGIVKQRYPNTKYVALADQQMQELRGKLEKTGGAEPPRPTPAPERPEPAPQVVPASFPTPPPPPHP